MRVLIFLLFVVLPQIATAETVRLDFSQGLSQWDEKVFNGQTSYVLVEQDQRKILLAQSHGHASALIRRVDIDPLKYSKLRWRWKIERVLEAGQAGSKAGDDYPARIYVIFESWLPNFARSINYIWASHLEQDGIVTSPYYHRSIMLAVESGAAKAGHWVVEERDLVADYHRTFGAGDIPRIRAVALMSDGDNTGESVAAWYDWIEFSQE